MENGGLLAGRDSPFPVQGTIDGWIKGLPGSPSVRFELMEQTRDAGGLWMTQVQRPAGSYLFPSRQHDSPHFSTRQYGRIVKRRSALFGVGPQAYGIHSLRRTKATLIYRRTFSRAIVRWRARSVTQH